MLSYLTVCANIGLLHFSFSIRSLVSLLFTPPSPLIPIYHQSSRIENVFITCVTFIPGENEFLGRPITHSPPQQVANVEVRWKGVGYVWYLSSAS